MTKQLKEIEIPFGEKDSELCGWEYSIPEGMEATIVDNKIVVKKKESEDERIRKWLIELVEEIRKANPTNADHNGMCSEAHAWLEKQGEQNPYSGVSFKYNGHTFGMCARDGGVEILMDRKLKAFVSLDKSFIYPIHPQSSREAIKEEKVDNANKVEPKFHEGDWIVFNGLSLFIKEVVPGYYRTVSRTGIPNSYDWDIDNIARRWTIDDAKPGDVLAAHECLVLFREIDGLNIRCYCAYHFMNNPSFYVDTLQNKEAFHPATKEQEDQLKKAMAEAGYTFDFDKKEFKKIEPKFKIGDFIINDYCFGKVIALTDDAYLLDSGQGIPFSCEHNAHLWTIQDAKEGDVLANDHHILILKELDYDWYTNGTPYSVHAYCGIKPNGNFERGKDNWCFCGTLHIHPASKEERNLLFTKMKEAGYEWDAEKKELKKIEQKHWSEEERQNVDSIIAALTYCNENGVSDCFVDPDILIDWLKSLKYRIQHQNTWKPSDEQMHYLSWIANIKLGDSVVEQEVSKHLNELLENLKKLKGE